MYDPLKTLGIDDNITYDGDDIYDELVEKVKD